MTLSPRVRRWLWVALGVLIALQVVVTILLSARIPRSSAVLRNRIVAALSWRLDSDVAIEALSLRAFPTLHAEGTGLTIRKRGQPANLPPLISIKSFTVDADLRRLAQKHVSHVTLEGLDIEVPPDDDDHHESAHGDQVSGTSGRKTEPVDPNSLEETVVIDTIETTDARLVIIPRKEHKTPKVWAIHHLRLHNVGRNEAMPFKATLSNAVPPGEIKTDGSFGPWRREDPGKTALDGTFDFARADLSVFRGIAGILSARGSFRGTLDTIDIHGETDTPDFTVNVSGHPFALHTKYHSIVDGTNGDTILERIDATFLQSALVAKGSVIDAPPGVPGRIVALDVAMDRARMEDVLRMAVKQTPPPMVGALKLSTKFLLPPGESDVADRLRLDGRFDVDRVRFTSIDVQAKIDELSHRSRGRDKDDSHDGVASDLKGHFKLGAGRLSLPDLSFAVPGATVQVAGQYALKAETLDFRGTLFMEAKVSETMRGFKSLLLKIVDPLFKRKDGSGSAIPIKIQGTWDTPAFALDMHRVFHRGVKP